MRFIKVLLLVLWNIFAVVTLSLVVTWRLRAWLVPDLSARSFSANFIFKTCFGIGACSFPTANVSTVVAKESSIIRGLTYDVWLDLTVFPDGEARTAGMFMLVSKCYDHSDFVWYESKRSGTLTFSSPLVHWCRLAYRLPWVLLGFIKEEERVLLHLMDNLVVHRQNDCQMLQVEIQSNKLTISKASVRFVPRVNFFYYYSYFWPTTSFLLINFLCCVLFASFSAFCWLFALALKHWRKRRKVLAVEKFLWTNYPNIPLDKASANLQRKVVHIGEPLFQIYTGFILDKRSVLFRLATHPNPSMMQSFPQCPGDYCGRTVDASGNLSDCGACEWGTRADQRDICVRCELEPTMYHWLYLNFMAFLPFLHHCAFAAMTMSRKQLSSSVIGSQILASAIECILAGLASLLMVEPLGSLHFQTCGVKRLADWYTVFYNPVINYTETIYCTQEAVYPLYFLPFLYYLLSLVAMIFVRPAVLYAFNVKKDDVSDAIYAALYLYPALIVLHAVLCGVIYSAFPFVLLFAAICLNAIHLALYPEQSPKAILKSAWQSRQNLASASTLLLIYTDAILSISALPTPWWTYFAFLFLPVPTIFYLLTIKFTDPLNLAKVN